jgi:hypothetical protein
MQPHFSRVWKEIGVSDSRFARRPVFMIPAQMPSLIMIYWAKGQVLEAGPNLKMTRIDQKDVSAAVSKYLMGLELTWKHQQELAGTLWAGIFSAMSHAGGVLLSVEAKAAGRSWLKAGKIKQEISVIKPVSYDVTFKFLHHLDDNGNMRPATNKDPASVEKWISSLNWILGAQANVWFDLEKAVPVKINHRLGRPIGEEAVRNYIAKEKDEDADVTVFLVGKFEKAGTFYGDLNVIALDDEDVPHYPVVEGDDPFIVVLAHELVHYVLQVRGFNGHIGALNALLNEGIESTVIMPELQQMLNP